MATKFGLGAEIQSPTGLSLWCIFFVFSMESSHFWPSFLHMALCKTLFFDFWFRPPNVQNLLPKICTKSPTSWLVWQIDRRCLGLPGGFRGWPIQWNHAKCCWADPCCHGNEIWARRGDPVAYRLISVVYLLVVSTIRSSSCASTTPTSVCSSSSTITCSCWNRKSTKRKAFSGSSLTSAWTFKLVLTSSKKSVKTSTLFYCSAIFSDRHQLHTLHKHTDML